MRIKVRIGRLIVIQGGEFRGKLAVVIDVVDQNRVLVDGPESMTGVTRHVANFKDISLTDIVIKCPRGARNKALEKAVTKSEALLKWSKTNWGKKLNAKNVKANLTDFQRFEVRVSRQSNSVELSKEVSKLRVGNAGKGNAGKGNTGKGNTGKGNTGKGNAGKGNTGKGNTGKGNTNVGGRGKKQDN